MKKLIWLIVIVLLLLVSFRHYKRYEDPGLKAWRKALKDRGYVEGKSKVLLPPGSRASADSGAKPNPFWNGAQ